MIFESIFIDGPIGKLEVLVNKDVLDSSISSPVAIICHPHPLHEGTMHNKVVTTISKALENIGIKTLRFNYRGVGLSEGVYGNYLGEVQDALCIYDYINNIKNIKNLKNNNSPIWLAGFSFGSYIAASVASKRQVANLITVAPAVESSDFTKLSEIKCPWLVIQGENDEIVSPDKVFKWYEGLDADKSLIKMENTTHFFHGKLVDLRNNIEKHYTA